jgi:GvpD gas vesicle protein
MNLKTPFDHSSLMGRPGKIAQNTDGWRPIEDPEGRFSTGIRDFDRILGGGFRRGSFALISIDETVGTEDLDLLLFPMFLNNLYLSRGIMAVLPGRDSPHDFRARLTRFVTRRRFDSRVRVFDYIGEDKDLPFVVSLAKENRKTAVVMAAKAEQTVRGNRKKPYLEFTAYEVLEMLMGAEYALKLYFQGMKRIRMTGNLGIGILGPGLGVAAGARRMADTEVELHREDVGLIIRGVRPRFPSYLVTDDLQVGPPHVAFVPRPS